MTIIDILIWVTLIPMAPLLFSFLPWERWFPWDKWPTKLKKYFGPYFIYVSFVAWHLNLDWWASLVLALTGIGFIFAFALFQKAELQKDK